MQKINLKPCPFCGGKARLRSMNGKALFLAFVECVRCGATSKRFKLRYGELTISPLLAAAAWNIRTSSWIPCSERLPKNDGNYLCLIDDGIHTLPYRNGEFYAICSDCCLRCVSSRVTHWMPIPELPEGGAEA